MPYILGFERAGCTNEMSVSAKVKDVYGIVARTLGKQAVVVMIKGRLRCLVPSMFLVLYQGAFVRTVTNAKDLLGWLQGV